jgi:hypothetical protein
MNEDEPGVAMARWMCERTHEDVTRTTRSVRAFVARHGMRPRPTDSMTDAVSEVLAYVAPQGAPGHADQVSVDAAIDARWMTVIVRSSAPRGDGGAAFAAASALADRVEWHAESDVDITVVMEFPTGHSTGFRRGSSPSCHPGRRRSRSGNSVWT